MKITMSALAAALMLPALTADSLDIRAVRQPSLVAGPVFKTGEGQRELSLASSIPVLYRQLPSSLLRPGLSAEPVSRMFSL